MIVKTKWCSGGSRGALNLAQYIERGMHANRIYTVLYYGYRPIQDEDLIEIKNLADKREKFSFRHVIIAPENVYDERVFHYNVLRVMDSWIRSSRRYGVHYYWGLHYNTEHPHAHIGIVAPYQEEIIMNRAELKRYVKLVEEVFEEKYREQKNIEKEVERELMEAEVEL